MKNIVLFSIVCCSYVQCAYSESSWTPETHKKHQVLVKAGIEKEIAKHLIDSCKATAKNPVNCIKLGASILGAESSGGKKCHRNNCVGMNDGAVAYKSKKEGIDAWVKKYNKWWYNQKNPSSFYSGTKGVVPKTRYCMGRKKDGYCPEGANNSWSVFNKLNF